MCSGRSLVVDKLRYEGFHSLMAELTKWRDTTPTVPQDGMILGLVKGLRLQAKLIYILRVSLSRFKLDVDWGHLVDEKGDSCSPECDVIIHRQGKIHEWNGTQNPVMDFKFITSERALAVVSCKSKVASIDRKYYNRLSPYVKTILLFGECCSPKKVPTLVKKAESIGYSGFWYLYTRDEETGYSEYDVKVWDSFLSKLNEIAQNALKST